MDIKVITGSWPIAQRCVLQVSASIPGQRSFTKAVLSLWPVAFFSKGNLLELLGGSDTAVWASLKSNSL